ncbi:MAG: hypothetical protein SOW59_03955 [Corynebacterium sp.]|nr:hypothetical protein [Corynebacterium sp.]
MSANEHAVADFRSETYPNFSGQIQDTYLPEYDPSSLAAPHSSLLRTATWVGMGLILSVLPFLGALVWGWAETMYTDGTAPAEQATWLLIVGAVGTIAMLVGGFVLIRVGRTNYRQYRESTGRIN